MKEKALKKENENMKNTKLLTTLGAVALVGAIGVGSTFAYLTDKTGTVKNTFTVGNVVFEEDDEVGSGLRESDVKRNEETGNYEDNDGENNWTKTENEYKNLVAGETVYKDPTVVMDEKSEVAWVFAKIENVNDPAFESIAWSQDWVDVTDAYKAVNADATGDFVVYAKAETIAPSESSTIFTSVTMSKDITGETVISDIVVKAFAIQAAGFDTYADAMTEVVFE